MSFQRVVEGKTFYCDIFLQRLASFRNASAQTHVFHTHPAPVCIKHGTRGSGEALLIEETIRLNPNRAAPRTLHLLPACSCQSGLFGYTWPARCTRAAHAGACVGLGFFCLALKMFGTRHTRKRAWTPQFHLRSAIWRGSGVCFHLF